MVNNFLNLPDYPKEEDLIPFQAIYRKYYPMLSKALTSDISPFGINLNLTSDDFFSEDEDAQKATVCYIYAELHLYEVKIVFKYLVFQNIIHCYLYGDISDKLLNNLVLSDKKPLKILAQNYDRGSVEHLYNLE